MTTNVPGGVVYERKPKATDKAEPAVEQPCLVHFPDGWPEGVTSAGCMDGQWDRELPPVAEESAD